MTTDQASPDSEASERGRRATQALMEHGRKLGLESVAEYPVPGGRLDVVWLWRPPTAIPGSPDALPVVGFEIESSWRTRKHIKGDLINLQDLATAFGVIVLLGDGEKVESTRRFASQLVDRPGSRIVVWSEADMNAMLEGTVEALEPEPTEVTSVAATAVARAGSGGVADHAGKYRPLWAWLRSQEPSSVMATFGDVERVLGFPLPPSCRRHLPHWYGYDGTAVGRAIRDAGWRVTRVSLEHETVPFERTGYFCPDPDSTSTRLVFNRTVGLRDTWAKVKG